MFMSHQLLEFFPGKHVTVDQGRSKCPADLVAAADLVCKNGSAVDFDLVDQPQGLFNVLCMDVVRTFVYCSFLVGMLPVEVVPMEDIEKMLSLEMYKLEKTFDGDISLGDESGVYAPAEPN